MVWVILHFMTVLSLILYKLLVLVLGTSVVRDLWPWHCQWNDCIYLPVSCDVDSFVAVLARLVARQHSTELQMTAAKWFVFYASGFLCCRFWACSRHTYTQAQYTHKVDGLHHWWIQWWTHSLIHLEKVVPSLNKPMLSTHPVPTATDVHRHKTLQCVDKSELNTNIAS